jgi:hypothetical protein
MSDVVSNDELNALAAEYVLGTLDYEERKGANALLEVDPTFRGIVRIWERRFGDLHLMVESVEPDPQLWVRIKPKMAGIEQIAPAIPSSAEVPAAPAAATPAAEAVAVTPPAEPVTPPAEPASPAPEAAAAAPVPEGAPAAEPKTEAVPTPVEGTAPAAAETPPAEVKPPAIAEAELKLAELAALLPVTAEQRDTAPAAQPSSGAPPAMESMPEDGLHTHAPDLVPRGFVPPAPMMTRGTPIVVEKPVHKSARGWVAATLTMALVAVALAGLISAWRFFPERLPAQLRATTLLNLTASPQAPGPKARPKLAPFDE